MVSQFSNSNLSSLSIFRLLKPHNTS